MMLMKERIVGSKGSRLKIKAGGGLQRGGAQRLRNACKERSFRLWGMLALCHHGSYPPGAGRLYGVAPQAAGQVGVERYMKKFLRIAGSSTALAQSPQNVCPHGTTQCGSRFSWPANSRGATVINYQLDTNHSASKQMGQRSPPCTP